MMKFLVLAMIFLLAAITGARPIYAQDFTNQAVKITVPGLANKGVTGAGLTSIPGAGVVSGYLNININGTASTIAAAPTFNAGDVAVGDFNGDGLLDIVSVNSDATFSNPVVVYLIGQGDGTFGFPIQLQIGVAGYFPVAVASADIDLDGLTDVAVALTDGVVGNPGFVRIFSGVFLQSVGNAKTNFDGLYPTAAEPVSIAFGHLNDDMLQDFAVAETTGAGAAGQFEIYFSDQKNTAYDLAASGPFQTMGTIAQDSVGAIPAPRAIAIQQNNLIATEFGNTAIDSTADIFVATSVGVEFFDNAGVGQAPTILSNGTTPFLPAGANPNGIVVSDVNKDNTQDVLILNRGSGTVSTFLAIAAQSGGYMSPLQSMTGANPISLTTMNFDGDANTDLAVVTNNLSGDASNPGGNGNLQILLGNGDGSFTTGRSFSIKNDLLPIFNPQSVVVGHFDSEHYLIFRIRH